MQLVDLSSFYDVTLPSRPVYELVRGRSNRVSSSGISSLPLPPFLLLPFTSQHHLFSQSTNLHNASLCSHPCYQPSLFSTYIRTKQHYQLLYSKYMESWLYPPQSRCQRWRFRIQPGSLWPFNLLSSRSNVLSSWKPNNCLCWWHVTVVSHANYHFPWIYSYLTFSDNWQSTESSYPVDNKPTLHPREASVIRKLTRYTCRLDPTSGASRAWLSKMIPESTRQSSVGLHLAIQPIVCLP